LPQSAERIQAGFGCFGGGRVPRYVQANKFARVANASVWATLGVNNNSNKNNSFVSE
jgi:hypothetical protein